jgi:hypothetical protein
MKKLSSHNFFLGEGMVEPDVKETLPGKPGIKAKKGLAGYAG